MRKTAQTHIPARDAIELLTQDHERVKDLFFKFEHAQSDNVRKQICTEICQELDIHTAIEEEIFYPQVREAIDDDDLMDEAEEEHAVAKQIVQDLQGMEPDDEHYAAKVTVLAENVKHHIKEEESQMFPKVKKTDLDLAELGSSMMQRKRQLQEMSGLSGEGRPRGSGHKRNNIGAR